MIIISPAKKQQKQPDRSVTKVSLAQTQVLLSTLSQYSPQQLMSILNVNEKIAREAYQNFQHYAQKGFLEEEKTAAIDLYQGDVYQYLDVASLSQEDTLFLAKNVAIISAFYGVIRPLDGIWPYRLEMISRLEGMPKLSDFWRESAQKALQDAPIIFNLASNAYAETLSSLRDKRWVDIVFQDKNKLGEYVIVAVRAKRMRGLMLRYLVTHQIQDPEALLGVSLNGYTFYEEGSTPSRLVFRS